MAIAERKRTYAAVWIGIATLALLVAAQSPVSADHTPANKAAVAGSTFEQMQTQMTEGASSSEVSLLSATVRTTKVSDLALQVTLECALWTDVTVIGNDESTAVATVSVWVEQDGVPVPVSDDDTDTPGRVVFCNRAYTFSVTNLDDEDANFTQFLRTRNANAFNWFVVNAGTGVHTFEVKAQLEVQVDGIGQAHAAVGKRTLVIDPIHLVNDA